MRAFYASLQNCEKHMLASSYVFVRPHGTTTVQLNGFSWDLIFDYISKMRTENSNFIKISQE